MSNYQKQTRHPVTGKWQEAEWLDNYFGPHRYGVRFMDGTVINPEEIKLETRERSPAQKPEVEEFWDENFEEQLLALIIEISKFINWENHTYDGIALENRIRKLCARFIKEAEERGKEAKRTELMEKLKKEGYLQVVDFINSSNPHHE